MVATPRSATESVLREGLLSGERVLVAGPADDEEGSLGASVAASCARLGAKVAECRPGRAALAADEELPVADAAQAALVALGGPPRTLVVDGAALFGVRGAGRDRLAECMQGTWALVRAVAAQTMLGQGGRVLMLAPPPGAGEHADAARAALENLARTLSIEWARHEVTAVCVAPGDATSAQDVATLVAYLASRAGAYFSGCVLPMSGG